MDNIQFLDLIGLSEEEIDKITSCLFEGPVRASLPWYFGKKSAKAKILSAQSNYNGIAADNLEGPTDDITYTPPMAYYGVPFDHNQMPAMISCVPNHYQHPAMYHNFHHPPQVMANTVTDVHFVYQTNQGYNYNQVPLTYPEYHHNVQYYSPVHDQRTEELQILNGESQVDDEPIQVTPQDFVVDSTQSNGENVAVAACSEPEVKQEIINDNFLSATNATTITENNKQEAPKISPKISPEKNGNKKTSPSRKKTKFSSFEQKDTIPIIKEKTQNNTVSLEKVNDHVQENGIKHHNSAPVNVWNKKPGATLFKKDAPITNGHLVVENSRTKSVQQAKPIIDPATYRLGEYLANYTLNGKSTNLQPRGLINKSNYCYVNSILQALLACPPLCNLLKGLSENLSSIGSDQSIPMIENMCKFVNEFSEVPESSQFRTSKKNKKKRGSFDFNSLDAFEATSFYTLLNGTRSDSFLVEGRQEDAEEFLGLLLNGLNDEMMSIMKLIQKDISSQREENQDPDDWKVMGPKNKGNITRKVQYDKTPISDIFGGLLCSKIHKMGDETTVNIQPFLTLQLNIETANTISEALEQLTVKNQLEGLTSSKTKQKVEAWQQVMIEQLPKVLVLHLKCFDYQLNGCTKIMKVLDFPIDLQIDSKILSGKTSSVSEKQYKLFAVVYHEGKEASKGHYVADVFHTGYNTWMRFDDAKIKSISEENVLKPQGYRVPYLLFYRRD